ncbi:MAG TPA: hypothetical protein VIG46_05300 [Candidatus Baltobacteraceae bacterium]|jgi:hypothetical protein
MKRLFALALLVGSLASVAPASSKGPLRVTVTNDVYWHGPATMIVSQTGMGITMTVAPHTTSSISVPLLATTLRLKTQLCDTKLALPLEYLAQRTQVWVTIHEGCILRLRS